MWERAPTADELLARRLAEGWQPTPSYLQTGLAVLGHARTVPRDRWSRPGSGCS